MVARKSRYTRRVRNALMRGTGANTTTDRGAMQTPALGGLSPFFNNNFLYRYQQYAIMYETSWEARKIIDIPVDDAMRQPTIREGLLPDDEQAIAEAWEMYGVDRQLRRAMKQERLLGGCVILAAMKMQQGETPDQPLDDENVYIGDLEALNVVDILKLSRPHVHIDPFAANYDSIDALMINGIVVDASRMVIFDGEALFGRNSQRVMQMYRYNPLGFGESKLAPLYDALSRALGTQQGAYQLVNVSSLLLLTMKGLRNTKATNSPAEEKLKDVLRQVSIYNGAVVDGESVTLESKGASFGSVPELVLTFTQFLAAASDIPITRFLGNAAQGLSATGEGDARNYYDMVDTIRTRIRKPAERRILDWIGSSLWGWNAWKEKSKNLVLDYEPLWNLDAVQQATRDETVVRTMVSLYQAGMISAEAAVNELRSREMFDTEIEAEEFLTEGGLPPSDAFQSPVDVPQDTQV